MGFNPNYVGNDDWTTIEVAAYFGHLDVVKFLVNVDTPDNYALAIQNAESEDHEDVVDFLKNLGEGKDGHDDDEDGDTIVMNLAPKKHHVIHYRDQNRRDKRH